MPLPFLVVFCVLDCCIMAYIFFNVLHLRFSKPVSFGIYALYTAIATVKHILFFDRMSIRTVMQFALCLLVLFILFTDSIWKKLGVMFVYMVGAIIVESATAFMAQLLFGKTYFADHEIEPIYYLVEIFPFILYILIATQILNRKKECFEKKSARFLIIYSVLQITTGFVLYLLLWDYRIQAAPVMIAFTLVAILSVVFGILLHRTIQTSLKERAKAEQIRLQMALEEEHIKRLQLQYDEYKKLRNDYFIHINTIRAMRDTNAKNAYIDALTEKMRALDEKAYCTNAALDALLFNEKTRADKLGIRAEFKADGVEDLSVPDIDVCTVVANLLAFAITLAQAADVNSDRFVSALLLVRDGQLVINVRGTSPHEPDASQKESLGMKIVDELVEKYQGTTTDTYDKGIYSYTLSIPLA